MAEARIVSRRDFVKTVAGGIVLSELTGCSTISKITTGSQRLSGGIYELMFETAEVPEEYRMAHGFLEFDCFDDNLPRIDGGIIRIRRPFDLLDVGISFAGHKFECHLSGEVVKPSHHGCAPSYTLIFPPQHVTEGHLIYSEAVNPLSRIAPGDFPIRSFRCGDSRLVFQIPEGGINYTLEDLLNLENFAMRLAANASSVDENLPLVRIAGPLVDQTSLEVPWGMVISPDEKGFWRSATLLPKSIKAPDWSDSRSREWELWRVELLSRDVGTTPNIRVIDARPDEPSGVTLPATIGRVGYSTLPNPEQREQLRIQTSTRRSKTNPSKKVTVQGLNLSSVGADVAVEVNWEPNEIYGTKYSINRWKQQTSWGRDGDVLVSYLGFCFPFCFPISWVSERRREFDDRNGVDGKSSMGVMREVYYCQGELPDPKMLFPKPSDGQDLVWEWMPYERIDLIDTRSPYLDQPPCCGYGWMFLEGTKAPLTDDEPFDRANVFKWRVRGFDRGGRNRQEAEFTQAFFWIRNDLFHPDNRAELEKAIVMYRNEYRGDGLRVSVLNQQKLNVICEDPESNGESSSSTSQDATLEVNAQCFAVVPDQAWGCGYRWGDPAENTAAKDSDPILELRGNSKVPKKLLVPFYPALQLASVRLHQTASFDRQSAGATSDLIDNGLWKNWPRLSYNRDYLLYGLYSQGKNSNPSGLYADIANSTLIFNGSGGGVVYPGFEIKHLSTVFGPTGAGIKNSPPVVRGFGGTSSTGTASFVPNLSFGGPELSNLFGPGIGLGDIVQEIADAANNLDKVPQLLGSTIANILATDLPGVREAVKQIQDLAKMFASFSTSDVRKLLMNLAAAEIAENLSPAFLPDCYWIDGVTSFDDLFKKLSQNAEKYLRDRITDEVGAVAAMTSVVYGCIDDAFKQYFAAEEYDKIRAFVAEISSAPELLDILRCAWEGDEDPICEILLKQFDDTAPILVGLKNSLLPYVLDVQGLRKTIQDALAVAKSGSFSASLTSFYNVQGSFAQKLAHVKASAAVGGIERAYIDVYSNALNPRSFLANLTPAWKSISTGMSSYQQFAFREISDLQAALSAVASDFDRRDLPGLRRDLSALFDLLQSMVVEFAGLDSDTDWEQTLRQVIARDIKAVASLAQDAINTAGSSASAALTKWMSDASDNIGNAIPSAIADNLRHLQASIIDEAKVISDVVDPLSKAATAFTNVANTLLGDFGAAHRLGSKIGSADITNLLKTVKALLVGAVDAATSLLRQLDQLEKSLKDLIPKDLNEQYTWAPALKSSGVFQASYQGTAATLKIVSGVKQSLSALVDGSPLPPPSVSLNANIDNFQLNLIPAMQCLSVGFKSVRISSVDGSSPDVKVSIGTVEFGEALKFLADLAAILDPAEGPYVEVQPSYVRAGFRLSFPGITLGALNIFNLAIDAGAQLRFDGQRMNLSLGVSSIEKPFAITCDLLGGFGFFNLTGIPNHIETLSAALEFGGAAEIDLGFTEAEGLVGAGIFHSVTRDETILEGFVNASGVIPLGIADLSVDFLEGVSYVQKDGQSYATGEVTVTVDIHVFMADISFDLHYSKQFAGSSDSSGAKDQGAAASGDSDEGEGSQMGIAGSHVRHKGASGKRRWAWSPIERKPNIREIVAAHQNVLDSVDDYADFYIDYDDIESGIAPEGCTVELEA